MLRSGEVLGLGGSADFEGQSTGVVASAGLNGSTGLGVGMSLLGTGLNQKCFFFVGGLSDKAVEGVPEADSGLLGRLVSSSEPCFGIADEIRDAGSAVRGRGLVGLSSSMRALVGELTAEDEPGIAPAMEMMLPDKECPLIVEQLPSVSEDISDNGLGIISTLSANPTLGRGPFWLSRLCGEAGGDCDRDIDCLGGLGLGVGNTESEGVAGCDPARDLDTAAALIRSEVSMSEMDIACDLLWVCPLGWPLTGGGLYSLLAGLVLISCVPSLPPPTNSLPLRL